MGFVWTKATTIIVALALILPVAVAVPTLAKTFGADPTELAEDTAGVDAVQKRVGQPAVAPEPEAADPGLPAPAPPPARAQLPALPQPSPAAPRAAQPAVAAPPVPAPQPAVAAAAGPFHAGDIAGIENRLVELSYLVGEVDGVMDGALKHGITAFQKVEGLNRTGELDAATLSRLNTATRPEPRFSGPPTHFEVDIPRQVVFVVQNGSVLATLPTSTGNNELFTSQGYTRRAVTPNGTYKIDFKRQGWRYAPLGALYRPSYFNGGIAFHGSKSIPTSPASHGCVRLPMQFADWFADIATIGSTVYVYGGPSGENPQPEREPEEPEVLEAAAAQPAEAPAEPAGQGGDLLGGLLGG
ncbi:MAG: L,D-transpeptidase family protein [Actinomycetota bacterium]